MCQREKSPARRIREIVEKLSPKTHRGRAALSASVVVVEEASTMRREMTVEQQQNRRVCGRSASDSHQKFFNRSLATKCRLAGDFLISLDGCEDDGWVR
ncbi:unnamed protein product [Strongylus vulgaris]|uniref:Uncharacterized protein n=1 Tax=Strongylus vulgaris TaxID=40348 RepID=A0A3P7IUH4_STRVU|nr:unnamed protein product [Strongylus vulgaris]